MIVAAASGQKQFSVVHESKILFLLNLWSTQHVSCDWNDNGASQTHLMFLPLFHCDF